MIYSKSMRQDDYLKLVEEQIVIKKIVDTIGMWYPYQHQHRVWEYAMALAAFRKVFPEQNELLVTSDHGCGAGFMAPILYWLGNTVRLYECWTMGDASEYMLRQ